MPGPTGPLQGSLVSADGAGTQVLLIIPGSGPIDRDGNSPLGVRANTYKLLATELASRGISTARIDKRGLFGSAGATSSPNDVSVKDYAHDVRTWVRSLRYSTGAPCVWLLGHSEGGLVALAAAQSGDDICGLVLVATPGRPLGELLKQQLRTNPNSASLSADAEILIDTLQAGRRVDVKRVPEPLIDLFRPEIQDFLIEAFTFDPREAISKIMVPILIVQGDRDLQVGVPDALALKAAAPAAKKLVLPNVNHVLKTVLDEDPQANISTYTDPSAPLADGIADAIADFVHA